MFNYDIFTVTARDGIVKRLTSTKSAEYEPVWSPDGTRIAFSGTTRELTSSETTKEDTHVWVMRADGSARIEVGQSIDNRQGAPQWSPDGRQLYFTLQERGNVRLASLPVPAAPRPRAAAAAQASDRHPRAAGDRADPDRQSARQRRRVLGGQGQAGLCLHLAGLARGAVRHGRSGARRHGGRARATPLTTLNQALLGGRQIAPVEAISFTNEGFTVEAFLTRPVTAATAKPGTVPLIVMIHGGPHGQQGPAFNHKAQVYAGLGWASLMVNYRGSTGYGQKFADAIFRDQNGAEARDVLAGVDAALAKYPWLDANRLGIEGGSYGGQLTNWIVTQTPRFKAAVPSAGISNLVTQNYLAYYHDYLAVEYGAFPHERARGDAEERLIIDMLWERSPIRYANKVKTPVLFVHGENDNDVPIEEAEQFYIALHDVGVETIMLRYPREGHGLRESRHITDALERSIAWYRKHFGGVKSSLVHRFKRVHEASELSVA